MISFNGFLRENDPPGRFQHYVSKYSSWNTCPMGKVSVPNKFVETVDYIILVQKHIVITIGKILHSRNLFNCI